MPEISFGISRTGGVALAVLALVLGGCAKEGDRAAASGCRAGAEHVRAALRAAPAPVTVDGTSLSECLADTTDGGALQDIGSAYVTVAIDLADEAAREPEGRASLELGYLLGTMERSSFGAQGVGYELGRRVRAELARVDTGSRSFRRGLRAGRRTG